VEQLAHQDRPKTSFYLKWFQKGIFFVKHLLKANRADFLSHADFQSTFWIKVNALEFFGMISALKQLLKSSVQPQGNNNKKTQPTFATSFFQAQGQADLSIRNSFKERQLCQKRVKTNGSKTALFHQINQFNGNAFIVSPLNIQSAQDSSLFTSNSCIGG